MGVIVPAASGSGAVKSGDAGLPDLWSGIWPAQLMDDGGGATPLGTLTWKAIRYEDGAAAMGKNFGGQPFTGCPDDGRTRFFRGHYVEGGDLIACTRGEDTKELVGRFNGREDFRSGSFVVKMLTTGFFLGRYDEDGGITTKWCGELKQRFVVSSAGGGLVDTTAPTLRFGAPARAKAGAPVLLTIAARDNSSAASVDISVLKGPKALTRMNAVAVRPNGAAKVVSWRVPLSAKGKLRICAAAFDRAGNASNRKCVRLTVT
jgi:predicted secreted protein